METAKLRVLLQLRCNYGIAIPLYVVNRNHNHNKGVCPGRGGCLPRGCLPRGVCPRGAVFLRGCLPGGVSKHALGGRGLSAPVHVADGKNGCTTHF